MRFSLPLLFTLALAITGCQKANDAAFGEKVHAYLRAHPEVVAEALQTLQTKTQLEKAKSTRNLVRAHWAELHNDPRDFVANPKGKITVVELYDYRCGYCKVTAPEIVKLVEENPDVRFVFKNFPIFGGVSNLAAEVSMTPQGKSKGLEIYSAFMADKALDEASIRRHLVRLGLDPVAVASAAKAPEIQKYFEDTKRLAAALGIEGTPAFIIGDVLIPGADMEAVRQAIANAKAGPLKTPPVT